MTGQERKEPISGRVRLAVPMDVPAVSAISAVVFAPFGDYSEVLPLQVLDPDVRTWVFEIEECGVVAFLQLKVQEDEVLGQLVGDVLAVGVWPEYQGRGIAPMLFQQAFRHVAHLQGRDKPKLFALTVADTNTRARRLFERLGFKLTGMVRGRYEGGQLALVMTRPASEPWEVDEGPDPEEEEP